VHAQLPAATDVQPDRTEKTAANGDNKPSDGGQLEMARDSANAATAKGFVSSAKRPHGAPEVATAAAVDRQGFVALMFCDPQQTAVSQWSPTLSSERMVWCEPCES
jgi:hypothetical protein